MKNTSLIAMLITTIASTASFAGLPEMMKIYNNPKLAPKIAACKGDVYCNGFIALSKQWKDIPNAYRYQGKYDIKSYARKGVTYDNQGRNIGLHMGFYFRTDRTNNFIEGFDSMHYKDQDLVNNQGGLAVLLYIEDKNGWAKD
ncbi:MULTISPECIES: hypothetical protein [Acinetobacter]|uniref:Uncharacterized protein n=1 Tax=Acinetobacter piscicola TaxID=2006115 RepID=A0A7S7AH24_9GAMM|nr:MULTISPECIES: hypothetical protein [Acinetobacter]QOW45529.1 hypothetical protein G0028_06230 [Acinetobacter piscicola]